MGTYYAGMMNSRYSRELRHHGIIGQKWGVQNGPPYPIKSSKNSSTIFNKNIITNIKGARTSNLDKWGKDAEHNTLYIAGYSGSGKSTTALGLKKPGDTVVHLDGYTEPGDHLKSVQDRKFNKHLDKTVPKWKEIAKSVTGNSDVKPYSKEYWSLVDDFLSSIEGYSTKEFKEGHRVIVEGVQIADDWFGDPKKLNGKPIIILGTNPISSTFRAYERDDMGNPLKAFNGMNYIKQTISKNKNLRRLSEATDSHKNQKYIPDFIDSI